MHCDPESRYSYGDALLHEACRTNRKDIVRFLLSSGRADPWTKNVTNQTPLQCCIVTMKYQVCLLISLP